MVIIVGNGHGAPNSKPGQGCLHNAYTFCKRYESNYSMGKIVGQIGLVSLEMATSLGKEKLWT